MTETILCDLGYYTVENKIFYNKTEAMLYASQVNGELKWFYHKDKFDSVNWTIEPEISLDDFYKIRAQQIRNKYDYVAVFLSGGSDSTNVVMSFINNDIHIDEIIISEPTSGMNNFKVNDKNTNKTNHISEIQYAAIPLASKIKSQFPNIRITMNDIFENILNFKDEEWVLNSVDWTHPSSLGRFSINSLTHIKKLAEEGKKIGLVYGVDKPVVICDSNDNINLVLVDYGVNVPQQPFDIIYPNVDRILFYWTPDLPELMVKQAHTVAKEIYKPENKHVLELMYDGRKPILNGIEDRVRHNKYERLIMHWIYPSIKCDVFQVDKHCNLLISEYDIWLYDNHKNERVSQMVLSDISFLIKSINPRFLTNSNNAFERHIYKWVIGPESKFKQQFII